MIGSLLPSDPSYERVMYGVLIVLVIMIIVMFPTPSACIIAAAVAASYHCSPPDTKHVVAGKPPPNNRRGAKLALRYRDLTDRIPYSEDQPAPKNMHVGQLKLLLNEVQFLTKHAKPDDTVVYAGSSPGHHIPYLASLFLNVQFRLYDPAAYKPIGFTERDDIHSRIKYYQEYFTDEIAKEYSGRSDVLFVSDIRSFTAETPLEKHVFNNMIAQRRWVEIIKPRATMLKFRIPYDNKAPYDYLDGEIYLQPWAPARSTESRLIITDSTQTRVYDPLEYEEKFNHHSTISRPTTKYDVPEEVLSSIPGALANFDTALEVHIWKEYLSSPHASTEATLIKLISDATDIIHRTRAQRKR